MGTRRTKIVCTLGPATSEEAGVEALMQAGMDVARLNFSHGTHETHATAIALVRAVAERLGRPVAILQDLQGPKIRTGALVDGAPVTLRTGARFTITTRPIVGTADEVSTTYDAFASDVKAGDRVLLSDGAIALRVVSVAGPDVHTTVANGGALAENQGINLPGVAVSAGALTAKDREDLAFGVAQGVDYVALSFVRRSEDVEEARRLIAALIGDGAARHAPPVIAKIEKPEAVDHLDAILAVAGGVMVARGDLGVELPLEQVPLIQKRIIARANALGVPVITATQMLESMISRPRPTRAEASDVANAILDGTDAVMLSGETAVGAYPDETVRVMARIAEATEKGRALDPIIHVPQHRTHAHAVSGAAHALAREAKAKLIVVFTRSGLSARLISKERPDAPIIAYTPSETVYRRLALWWGVRSYHSEILGSTDELIAYVDQHLQSCGLVVPGDEIVIMGGMPLAAQAQTNFLKLHRIGQG